MASGYSDWLGQKLLDHLFNGVEYTPPDDVYVALCTTAPTRSTGGTECAGGSYARQPLSTSAATSTADIASDANVAFTNMPACTITGAKLMDASTSGNMLVWIDGLSITVTSGQNLLIPAGDFTGSIR